MDLVVKDVMASGVIGIHVDEAVENVFAIFDEHALSLSPVLNDSGVCVGVISSSDLVHFVNLGKDKFSCRAQDICQYAISISTGPNTPLKEAIKLMLKHAVHHMIVLEDGDICGVVSSLDILEISSDFL